MFFSIIVKAQPKPTTLLANKGASKMKNSLLLNEQQRSIIYSINILLAEQKDAARKTSTDRLIIGKKLQKIENTRDSLYKQILTTKQYENYIQKKAEILNNK